jgi:hypothetical protein
MTGETILTSCARLLAVLTKSIVTTVIFFTCSEAVNSQLSSLNSHNSRARSTIER